MTVRSSEHQPFTRPSTADASTRNPGNQTAGPKFLRTASTGGFARTLSSRQNSLAPPRFPHNAKPAGLPAQLKKECWGVVSNLKQRPGSRSAKLQDDHCRSGNETSTGSDALRRSGQFLNERETPGSSEVVRRKKNLTREQEWVEFREKNNIGPGVKVFNLSGNFPGLRSALLERGWVENSDTESVFFDFKWCIKTNEINFARLQPTQVVNHYAQNRHVTTKVGLAKSLRSLKWFEEVDTETFFPRSYDLNDPEEGMAFTKDFMLLAALNVLERYVRDGENMRGTNGYIIGREHVRQVQLAIEACEGYVAQCDVEDFDDEEEEDTCGKLSAEEWSTILGEDCPVGAVWLVIGCDSDTFSKMSNKAASLENLLKNTNRGQEEEKIRNRACLDEGDVLTNRATRVIQQVRDLSPQSSINGEKNSWIVKPAGKSRGRGIQVCNSLKEILSFVTDAHTHNGERWIAQKYVENPLLVDGRKFDLRQWVLVTDLNPLTVWLYSECYARFALEAFDLGRLDNRMSHLCNNCVQRESENYEAEQSRSMWSQSQFLAHLESIGAGDVWSRDIRPSIERIAVWAIMSAQDLMESRKASCELYGYDFLIDSNFKVWLLEVNSSPDMAPTTAVTERLCYACLHDVARILLDPREDLGGSETRDASLGSVDANTRHARIRDGSWELVYKGEVEVTNVVGVVTGLMVVGKRIKVHKPSMQELYDKLGMHGTSRTSVLKISGCQKVFTSRVEMLKELNTTGLERTPPRRKRRPLSRKREDSSAEAVPGFVERLAMWDVKKKDKLKEIFKAKQDQEEKEAASRRVVFLSKSERQESLTKFIERMASDASKRDERKKEYDEKIREAVSNLDPMRKLYKGSKKRDKLRRTSSGRKLHGNTQKCEESESDDSSSDY